MTESNEYFPLLLPNSKEEYEMAMKELTLLMRKKPDMGSKEYRELETIASNIAIYEKRHYPVPPPDPIDAIKFRMQQKNLKQRDLIPYIGSKGRVSEILNRKRPLTLEMAQNLHKGLSIPAEVLLSENQYHEPQLDWSRFPIKELVKRGWIDASLSDAKADLETTIREFLKPLGMNFAPTILFRKTKSTRAKRDLEDYVLLLWMGRIAQRAEAVSIETKFDSRSLNKEALLELAQFSVLTDGPLKAIEYLKEKGIIVIVEKYMSGANLDAVLINRFAKAPLIGLTLLHDRIDNFWFSLFHELGHLLLHTTEDSSHFIDDFQVRYIEDPIENEADDFARETLLPSNAWRKSNAFKVPSPSAVKLLAKRQNIHPAIVAGRIRFEANNYQLLHQMVGQGEVRKLFKDY